MTLLANPLLEAFGNAKTIRNNNSSRFGKFIEIHYSTKFTVTGGLFFHYLLEKSRICTQSVGERNYHIFYQLCACLPSDQWNELELGPPDSFRYLSGGCTQFFCSRQNDSSLADERKSAYHRSRGAIQDQLIDDLKCYQQTDCALSNFGLSDQEKRDIYSIVAAVLHLGNISFEDDLEDSRGGCRIEASSERALETTARLMGLDKELLRQSLVSRIMSTTRGGHKGTVYMVQLSLHQAQAARDALAKAIYSKLFDHIVTKIVNKSIPFSSSAYYIGVLDVAGFEYFQHNSFEQFLINFCNEKLQQFFNERILKEEQNIYDKEGLDLRRVDFIDNQDCISLLEARSTGIFDLLDEESRLPRPSAQHFTQSVHAANKGHFRLAVPRSSKLKCHREIRDDEGFLIRHFAGAVCYETATFIDKNNDALHASLKNLMLDASLAILRDLFVDPAAGAGQAPTAASNLSNLFATSTISGSPASPSNKLNFVSVGTTFRSQLSELMGKLQATGSHFIRCIKPNSEMVAHKFEGGQILSQLHCSGMDSVLELMQQGYPSRSSFNDLYQTYARCLPKELARLDSHLFCRALFKVVGLNEADFRFGSSKVFFRPGKFAEFDQIIRSDPEHVAELVRKVSKWIVRSRWRKAQYCCLSVIKLYRKILYRRELIVRLQTHWRSALLLSRVRFRLAAIRSARTIERSLTDFEMIAREQLKKSPERVVIDEQTQLLRADLSSFIEQLRLDVQRTVACLNNNNGFSSSATHKRAGSGSTDAKLDCQRQLDKLATKRDLLIRSIKDKIAKQKEMLELERQVMAENKRREEEEMAKRRELELKQQRLELEKRRQAELESASVAPVMESRNGKQVSSAAFNSNSNMSSASWLDQTLEDQEQRDYEIALRLAQDGAPGGAAATNSHLSSTSPALGVRQPLAPSQNHANNAALAADFDLTSWKYSDLRDTINTSCDLELLEACKREFHRRLKVYHAWRAMNSRQAEHQPRAPSSVMDQSVQPDGGRPSLGLSSELAPDVTRNEQRFFRIPFVKGGSASSGQRGWWFAHFDGQWIARQLELHPGKQPILLIAGQHDIEMCELSLRETRLTSKRGAEILPQEFEEEWAKHGGQAYTRASIHRSRNK